MGLSPPLLRDLRRIHHWHFLIKLLVLPIIFLIVIGVTEGVSALSQWWKERPKIAADAWQTFAVPDSDLVVSLPGVPLQQSVVDHYGAERITEYRLDRADAGFEFGVGWLEPLKGVYETTDLTRQTDNTRGRLAEQVLQAPHFSDVEVTEQFDSLARRGARKAHLRLRNGRGELFLYVFLSEKESAGRAYFVWMRGQEIDQKVGDAALFFKSVSLPQPSQ
jgi:hypothetical protein